MIKAGIVPHKDKKTVLCAGLEDTPKTVKAIRSIAKKYPLPFMLASDLQSYSTLLRISETEYFFTIDHTHRPEIACLDIFDVIGILCGDDREFPGIDRKIMRCGNG